MWRIADSGGIEQPGGSFLHQRTHAPDPKLTSGGVISVSKILDLFMSSD
ncbi:MULTISPECIES: hypothetical protein [unclassified Caballeronia]|nr:MULTISPECIES: hypothetical protein [unclassified Caballeronia]